MRMRAKTLYVFGIWYVRFERVASTGILTRSVVRTTGRPTPTMFLGLIEGTEEPKQFKSEPAENETQFFFRCDQYMFDLTITLSEQPLSGPLVQPLVYQHVDGDMADAKRAIAQIDPEGPNRKWLPGTTMSDELKRRAIIDHFAKIAGVNFSVIELDL